MNYSNLQSNLFYGLVVVAMLYILFCVRDARSAKQKDIYYSKKFAATLAQNLNNVKELDDVEKEKINKEMEKILDEKGAKVSKIFKSSVSSAMRGGLAGGLIGGAEGALSGGIAFATITPVIMMIEGLM